MSAVSSISEVTIRELLPGVKSAEKFIDNHLVLGESIRDAFFCANHGLLSRVLYAPHRP